MTDSHLKELVVKALQSLSIRVAGAALGFLLTVMLARYLGAEGAGVYFICLSIIAILAGISRLGFDDAIVRFIAAHAAHCEWHAVQTVHTYVIRIVMINATIMSIILLIGSPWLAYYFFDDTNKTIFIQIAAAAIFPFSVLMVYANALRGMRVIVFSQLLKAVLVSLMTLILLYPFITIWGVQGSIMAYTLASMISCGCAVWCWRYSLRHKISSCLAGQVNRTDVKKRLMASNWPLFGVALSGIVIQQAAIIFLGSWSNEAETGVFAIAQRVSFLLLFPLFAVISILSPKIAALHHKRKLASVSALMRQTTLGLTLIALPVGAVVYHFANEVLALFGSDFADGVSILRILLIGVVVNTMTGPAAEFLMMTGGECIVRNINISGAVLLCFFCFLLIPFYAATGAAIAVSASSVLLNITMATTAWLRLRKGTYCT